MLEPSLEITQAFAPAAPVGADRDTGDQPCCGDLVAAVSELALQERFEERGVDLDAKVVEDKVLCGDTVERRDVEPPGAQGQQAESGFLEEGQMGIPQDLHHGCERIDGPVDVVAGGSLEPFQPVGYLQPLKEVEQAAISGKAVVIVFLDPVVVDPVGAEAAPRDRPSLEEIDLVFPGKFESRDQAA